MKKYSDNCTPTSKKIILCSTNFFYLFYIKKNPYFSVFFTVYIFIYAFFIRQLQKKKNFPLFITWIILSVLYFFVIALYLFASSFFFRRHWKYSIQHIFLKDRNILLHANIIFTVDIFGYIFSFNMYTYNNNMLVHQIFSYHYSHQ